MLILVRNYGEWRIELHHREGRPPSEAFLVRFMRPGKPAFIRASDRATAIGIIDGALIALSIANGEKPCLSSLVQHSRGANI